MPITFQCKPGVVLLIETRGLGYSYSGGQEILKSLDLTIQRGEFIGLIGPNGAGKSTLMRCLSGLIPATGDIRLDGKSLATIPRRMLSQTVGFVCQSLDVTFPLSCREFISMARYSRLDRLGLSESQHSAIIAEAMELTDTTPFANRCVTQLSGGEWQRVRLAQALAQEPRWLFLDEPTAHLDVRVQLDLLELLTRLNQQRQLTVILSIHDLNLAFAYCKRLWLLDKGSLVLDLPPQECAHHPALESVFQVQFCRQVSEANQSTWVIAQSKLNSNPL